MTLIIDYLTYFLYTDSAQLQFYYIYGSLDGNIDASTLCFNSYRLICECIASVNKDM